MIVLLFAIAGSLLGFRTAKKRDGNTSDLLQYTAVYALAFAILGLFVVLIAARFT